VSHFREVQTEITDPDILAEALANTEFKLKTGPEARVVRGWNGIQQAAEIVVTAPTFTQLDIGFYRAAEGQPFQVVADWSMALIDPDRFLATVRQHYAEIAAMRKAQVDRWRNFTRTVLPDGSIVLEAVRTRL
jgi:hypothetical protein